MHYLFLIMDLVKEEYVQQVEKKLSNPQIRCSSGNKVQKFCTRKDCKFQALCCRSQECPDCSINHEDCFFGEMTHLTKRVGNHLSFQSKVIKGFFRIQNVLIGKLTQSRKQIIDQYNSRKGSSKLPKAINSIYFKNNSSGLVGADMSTLFSQLSLKNLQESADKILKQYQKQSEQLLTKIVNYRQTLLQSLFRPKKQEKEQRAGFKGQQNNQIAIKQADSHKELNPAYLNIKSIDSKILMDEQKLAFICIELKNPSRLELLFRASQNNFSAHQFHTRCNNIKDTLTIFRTQYNKTLAAYTPIQWKSKGCHATDVFAQSFILQLDYLEKMSLKKVGKAIYDHHKWGPSFGQGDILICDRCHQWSDSYANFPSAYTISRQYKSHQQILTTYTGVPNGKNFRLTEYEVFKVIA